MYRSYRSREWLVEGVQKIELLKPICAQRGVTMSQLALLWLYAHPPILSALPNIYDEEQIDEFARASEHAALADAEMEEIHSLYTRNFDVRLRVYRRNAGVLAG